MFNPFIIGIFTNPFYLYRLQLRKSIKNNASSLHGNVLDVGCGNKPYMELFSFNKYTGIDVGSNRGGADIIYVGETFPVDSESYDAVICTEVLEHVFNPDKFLSEINRVLKHHGTLLLTVPFLWSEHEQPHDYARYSSFGVKFLVEKHGFTIIKQNKTGIGVIAIIQLINAHLYKFSERFNMPTQLLFCACLCSIFNILGLVSTVFSPLKKRDDLYLSNTILIKKNK